MGVVPVFTSLSLAARATSTSASLAAGRGAVSAMRPHADAMTALFSNVASTATMVEELSRTSSEISFNSGIENSD